MSERWRGALELVNSLPKVPPPPLEVLLYQAEKQGILPLTSECNLSCVFCSAAGNPPSTEVFSLPPRTVEDIRRSVPFLKESGGPVVIGESVTRINEGEPLTHPAIRQILELVRASFPDREIRLTTNGTLLNPETISLLKDLGIAVTISLNTTDVGKRSRFLGDPDPLRTLKQVESLASAGVATEGSVVVMPDLFGPDDAERTVRYLAGLGCRSVRLLEPGFSRYHPMSRATAGLSRGALTDLARRLTLETRIPVVAEPPRVTNLQARVEGCLPGSPAVLAGVRPGDVILRVNERTVFSRRHAMDLCRRTHSPVLTLYRQGRIVVTRLDKGRFSAPGFVVYDDIDPVQIDALESEIRSARAGRVLIMTSRLAGEVVRAVAAMMDCDVRVVEVQSRFFGGNIAAAGLLVVADFLLAVSEMDGSWRPDLVVLPSRGFDVWGRDLTGVSYRTFSRVTRLPVVLAG